MKRVPGVNREDLVRPKGQGRRRDGYGAIGERAGAHDDIVVRGIFQGYRPPRRDLAASDGDREADRRAEEAKDWGRCRRSRCFPQSVRWPRRGKLHWSLTQPRPRCSRCRCAFRPFR